MIPNNFIRRLVAITLFCTGIVPPASAATGAAPVELQWEFRIWLDSREIGRHLYTVREEQGALVMETEARMDVRFLFFNAFSYRHVNRERWDSAGLLNLESVTVQNGRKTRLRGQRTGDEFIVEVDGLKNRLPGEVWSFAYWNPAMLSRDRLLNAQTGEWEPVAVREVGLESVTVNGAAITARRFDVQVREMPIRLWYAQADDRWLALETRVKGGRTLRYEPIRVPEPESSASVIAVMAPLFSQKTGLPPEPQPDS